MSTDGFLVAEPMTVVDRSTLERFGECPAQARFVELGRVITSSFATESGNAVHAAFGELISEYVQSNGNLSVSELVDTAIQLLCGSRPDVQEDALRAACPSLWSFAKYLSGVHFKNVMRWDGGEGDFSGQLAHDMPDLGVRVTSEVDFIHGGKAKEVVTEIDWKSGMKLHTAASVESSFQFAMHAWIIFENYEDVQQIVIRVWNTRRNDLTYGVTWERKDDFYPLQYRMRRIVQNYLDHRDREPEHSETWPTAERCPMCPAAALCPAVPADIQAMRTDPAMLVRDIGVTRNKLDALEALAEKIVASTGRDLFSETGWAFGIRKPKAERKPTASLYEVKAKNGDD